MTFEDEIRYIVQVREQKIQNLHIQLEQKNQELILKNQELILKNQELILKNQELILKNQEIAQKLLENGMSIPKIAEILNVPNSNSQLSL